MLASSNFLLDLRVSEYRWNPNDCLLPAQIDVTLLACKDMKPSGSANAAGCYTAVTSGGTLVPLKVDGSGVALSVAKVSRCPSPCVASAKYCVHCGGANSKPLLCVAGASAVACTVSGTTLKPCRELKPIGSLVGSCYPNVTSGSAKVPALKEVSSLAAATAATCPPQPACSDSSLAANRYCVHCSPSGDTPLSCIAEPGKPCWTTYKVRSHTGLSAHLSLPGEGREAGA